MTTLSTTSQAARLIEKTELNCLVAIAFDGSQLQHVTRPGLNDRHRHGVATFVKNLSHPDLAAE